MNGPEVDVLLVHWSVRASGRISSKVSDARAHADKAVTEALRAEPDGRATVRRANRSPSYLAALSRLDELLADLCGPSWSSRSGVIRDAREAFYRESTQKWFPQIPEGLLARKWPEPTAAGVVAARTLVLHGQDVRREVGAPVDDAKRRLASAVVLAGSRDASGRTGADLLDAWERSSAEAIGRATTLALGDARVALDRLAGRDLIDPVHLDDTPLES